MGREATAYTGYGIKLSVVVPEPVDIEYDLNIDYDDYGLRIIKGGHRDAPDRFEYCLVDAGTWNFTEFGAKQITQEKPDDEKLWKRIENFCLDVKSEGGHIGYSDEAELGWCYTSFWG